MCSTQFVEQDSYAACEEAGALQQKQDVKGLLQSNQLESWYLKCTNSSLDWASFFTNLNDCILLVFDARKKETVSLNRAENDGGEVIWLVCKMSGN